ncbi:MAG: ferritin family protein [Eubacteriales bacterium]|nr:ferritin family protein [Eubacteriales bacterium]MDD3198774.1 ferritin family protein [Eubacteriales bacterium]MDD4121435.1 ferritin family protein [Eubacteriales bacterium]MDD4628980.1 ferritin family protein [Eubacteriales bacterium]
MNSLEFAIQMEMDNKRFYLEQAEKTAEIGLKSVFITLAEEESIHARILKNKAENLPYELVDTYAEIRSIFETGTIENIIKEKPDALDVYNLSLENEKKSSDLYEKMLEEATDENDKKIFAYLIEQENNHYNLIEHLIELIRRPGEWVESAEFGLRKEY